MEREERGVSLGIISRYRGAMMGLAALWVVFLHCWIPVFPHRRVLGGLEMFFKDNGTLVLEIFFFYSGMALTYAIRKYSLKKYYLRRFRRVLFPYWAVALLCVATGSWGLGELLKAVSGYAYIMENIQYFLWFVPSILILYLVYPLYHQIMMRMKDETVCMLCAMMIWLMGSVLLRDVLREDVWYMTNRIPSFLLGVWIGEKSRKDVAITCGRWLMIVLALVMGWMLRSESYRGGIELFPQCYFAATTLISVPLCFLLSGLYAWMEMRTGVLKAVHACLIGILSFVGTFSLELYCVHQWLYTLLYSMMEGHISYLMINMVSIPLLVLAGWMLGVVHRLFWKGVDSVTARNTKV